jgi:outer membrane lipoprotein-sorting protein
MFALVLSIVAVVQPNPETEAALLLGRMSDKVASAKALWIEADLQGPNNTSEFARLVLSDRKRIRIEGASPDPRTVEIIASDGRRTVQLRQYPATTKPPPIKQVPEWFNEELRTWLGRGGTMFAWSELWPLTQLPEVKRPPADDAPRATNLRLLPDETINGVKCRVVAYDLSAKGHLHFDKVPTRVWIDPRTSLPVRREMKFQESLIQGTWTCTHTRFVIDPKLSDSFFDLPTEPDLLLAQMDAAIRAAKNLRVELQITSPLPVLQKPARATMIVAERNRFRFELTVPDQTTEPWIAISDGRRMTGSGEKGFFPIYPGVGAPAWHNEVLRRWLARGGTMGAVLTMAGYLQEPGTVEPDVADGPVVAKARLLPDEMVNGVKARVVEYELTFAGIPRKAQLSAKPIAVRVWIDPKTFLPLRRTMDWGKEAYGLILTAEHIKFELDAKLDDKLFELPRR